MNDQTPTLPEVLSPNLTPLQLHPEEIEESLEVSDEEILEEESLPTLEEFPQITITTDSDPQLIQLITEQNLLLTEVLQAQQTQLIATETNGELLVSLFSCFLLVLIAMTMQFVYKTLSLFF